MKNCSLEQELLKTLPFLLFLWQNGHDIGLVRYKVELVTSKAENIIQIVKSFEIKNHKKIS